MKFKLTAALAAVVFMVALAVPVNATDSAGAGLSESGQSVEMPVPVGEGVKTEHSKQVGWAVASAWVLILAGVATAGTVIAEVVLAPKAQSERYKRKTFSRAKLKYKRHKISNRYNTKK